MKMRFRKLFAATAGVLLFGAFLTGCSAQTAPVPEVSAETVALIFQPEPTDAPQQVHITLPPPTATPVPTPTPVPTATPVPPVTFKNGSFPVDSTEITLVMEAGESAKLDELPALSVCHLEGSTCYEEILAFMSAHPEISVTYSVSVLGGSFGNDTESIKASVSSAKVSEIAEAFKYLPALKKIDLNGAALTAEDCSALGDLIGTSVLNYKVEIGTEVFESSVLEISLKDHPSVSADVLAEAVTLLPGLSRVDATGTEYTLEEIGKLQKSREGLVVDYPVTLFGKTFSTADRSIEISKKKLKVKQLDELRALAPYLTNCEKVVLDDCGLADEVLDELRTELEPYTEVVWRVKVGPYSCRTDSIMIKFSGKSTVLTDSKVKGLTYCHDVKYLDLGHNHLRHIDFVAGMPELEVCIIAVNYLVDITPIQNCTKLEYCEFLSNVSLDVTPLAACTELKHLNISYAGVKDISPLYGLTKLERLWISRNQFPKDQIETIRELLPNAEINTTSHNCTGEGWRENPRYDLLREQFCYDDSHTRSFYVMDGEIKSDFTK